VQFRDDAHLMSIIDRIVSAIGRRIDESSPMVDARLADGSRVNAIIPPLAVDGPCLSIRRFGRERLTADDLVINRSLTQPMLDLLRGCVKARLNILISGGTGAGKTTFLNVLSSHISNKERIVTIEDAAELQLNQEHVVRLETRPPNIEGKGQVAQRQLVINCLRMRPDRIIVGEVRGEEALDMLQAMNTGHDGSLTTIHANTPRDALGRLETMVAMANLNIPESAIRRQISSAIDVVVQVSRHSDGTRKVISVAELTGMEGNIVTMQDIFVFRKRGIRENGEVLGEFLATGVRPQIRRATASVRHSFPEQHVRSRTDSLRSIAMGALIAILTFLVVVVGFLGIWVFASAGAGQEQIRKRMSSVHKAERRGDVGLGLKLVRDEMMSGVPWLHQIMMKWSWSTKLQDFVMQAGMTLKPAKLLMICAIVGLGTYIGAGYFFPISTTRFLLGLSPRCFQLRLLRSNVNDGFANLKNSFRKLWTCLAGRSAPDTRLRPGLK